MFAQRRQSLIRLQQVLWGGMLVGVRRYSVVELKLNTAYKQWCAAGDYALSTT
jgi:hypothetical protein